MKKLLSVIIPTYNRLDILKLTLSAYEKQVLPEGFELELVVVDDGSSDGTWQYLKDYPSLRVHTSVYSQTNQGPAAARNLAISKAKGDYLLITGDDIIPEPGFAYGHISALLEGSAPAILGRTAWHPELNVNALMRHVDGIGAQQFGYHYFEDGQRLDFRHFYTSNISFSRSILDDIEFLFDVEFHYAAYEDIELGYRLFGDRDQILYKRSILGYHHHHYTLKGFCKRQYNAGQMAYIFLGKHPSLSKTLGFSEIDERINRFVKHDESVRKLERYCLNSAFPSLEELEDFVFYICELIESSDPDSNLLDGLYLGLLRHFYLKGMIESDYVKSAYENKLKVHTFIDNMLPSLREVLVSDTRCQMVTQEHHTRTLKAIKGLLTSDYGYKSTHVMSSHQKIKLKKFLDKLGLLKALVRINR